MQKAEEFFTAKKRGPTEKAGSPEKKARMASSGSRPGKRGWMGGSGGGPGGRGGQRLWLWSEPLLLYLLGIKAQ